MLKKILATFALIPMALGLQGCTEEEAAAGAVIVGAVIVGAAVIATMKLNWWSLVCWKRLRKSWLWRINMTSKRRPPNAFSALLKRRNKAA